MDKLVKKRMNIIKLIKNLALAEIIIVVILLSSLVFLESKLPDLLQRYLETRAEFPGFSVDVVATLFGFLLLIWQVVSSIGLSMSKAWAGRGFIYSTLALYAVTFFTMPVVVHPISYGLDQVHIFISGILVTLIIFAEAGTTTFNKAKQSGTR